MRGIKPPRRSSQENGTRAYAHADPDNRQYLSALGERIRNLRSQRGITRKALAAQSGVSERFLAQLESGTGNSSILLLRHLAQALDVPLASLVLEGSQPAAELARATEFLQRLSPADLDGVQQWLVQRFGQVDPQARRQRIALIGLRGAGKSTIGAATAKKANVPFFELDRLIEKTSGVPLSAMFDLYGQSGYRRFERACFDELLTQHSRFVVATGGSIVSEESTFNRLLHSCFTVWLKASPADHMKRVIAQGDMRPMSQSSEAMADLKRILAEREPLYAKADLVIDTSKSTIPSAANAIAHAANSAKSLSTSRI